MQFEVSVYPECVDIFETQQCGAVVRVWALDTTADGRWWLLWQGPPSLNKGRASRLFSPDIRGIDVLVK